MVRIKRNDMVVVLTGKYKGKTGKVLKVFCSENKALVESVNFIKRHARQTKQQQRGGIIQKEAPMQISKLMLICRNCNKPTRVGMMIMDGGSGKARVCKKCKEVLT